MGIPSNVFVFDTPEQVAIASAERFVECEYALHSQSQSFSVSLAGGKTPRRVYELLATERFKRRVEWLGVHLFFGDERCVPPDHPNSNYAMAYETLISKVPIPATNVHRIIGEANPDEAARLYENELRTHFAPGSWPRFDLVLLGMGADGHTASIFPNSEALREESRWVVATRTAQPEQDRITMTAPVFNHAANVLFLVTGEEKAARLDEVLEGDSKTSRLPAQEIRPLNGSLEWFVDKAAAARL